MSDRYFPWLEDQGHSGYAWAVLGAAAQATYRLPLMTMVTCPTFRYHPAVVAQKATTVGVLSGGRFTLGLGASLIHDFNQAGGTGKPKYRQLAICYGPDAQAARARARRLWRVGGARLARGV